LLYLFSTLILIIGIFQLALSFQGYQLYLSIKLYGQHSSTQSPIYQLDWETLWRVNHGWSLGITAILSAFLIFKNNIFAWSYCVASCTFLLFSSIFTLYKFQLNIMQYSDIEIRYADLFIPYKMVLIALSIFGLILLFNRKLMKMTPSHPIKYYLSLGMTAVLITLVYFV
jgi:hypothetical protein